MFKLRDYQQEAANKVTAKLKEHKICILNGEV